MPEYGTPQAGYNAPPNQGLNITSLEPGQQITLISAADAVAAAFKSVSFARGYKETGDPTITFTQKGAAAGSVCAIEAADTDVDGDYVSVGSITGNGFYTDIGSSAFYRAHITTYNSPDQPIVTATRL